jgi:predicted nucleic acid-binding protein
MKVVVDASVAFKWYVPEDDADLAQDLVASEHRLIAPEIIVAEVANASWKLVRKGELDPGQHTRIASALPRPFEELVPLTALLARAAAISLALDHPVYDCFYLALSEAREAPLVSADRRLLAKLRGSSFQVASLRSLSLN